jgi:superfamily I DNA/RNA helicase
MTTWTSQQTDIFGWFRTPSADRSLVVRARAGTGKTTTLIEALKYAPETTGGRVLLAAFNKRIADELSARAPRGVEVKTLHALGFAAIKANWGRVALNDRRGMMIAETLCGSLAPRDAKVAVAKLASIGKLTLTRGVEALIDIAPDFDCEPSGRILILDWTLEKIAGLAHEAMKAAAANCDEIDFDDMLWIPAAHGLAPTGFDLVVIDEAQDMNAAQLSLARSAVRQGGRVCVVGDDRQAIYKFMGADAGALDRMKDELEAPELPLSVTFRCPARIVAMANAYVPDYEAAPGSTGGEVTEVVSEEKLADFARPGDFVLSRSNVGSASACLSLLRAGVRAIVVGRDVGASLRRIVDTMPSGTLPGMLAALKKWADNEVEKAIKAGKDSKVDRIRDQQETIFALCSGLTSVKALQDRIAELFSDHADGRVACSTIHKAKGLETDTVFIMVPTFRCYESEEEDNIKYVAITRAKREVCFVGRPQKPDKPHPFARAFDGLRAT